MLTKYNPFSLWNDDFFFGANKVFRPLADIYENENEITVEMELPGMKLEEINIKVESNELKITGESKKEERKKEKGYFRSERFKGTFSRSFLLPKSSNIEEITASYKDGLLYVRIPKKLQSQAKNIEIKA